LKTSEIIHEGIDMSRYAFIAATILAFLFAWTPLARALDNSRAEVQPREDTLSLENALNNALTNNTAIKEAAQRYLAAREGEKSARADFLPKLSASYSYTNLNDQPFSMFNGMKIPLSSEEVYKWNLTAAQPLFTGFALITRYEMARYGVDLSKTYQILAMMDVTKQVREAYFNVLLAEKFFGVADEAVKNLESHARDAERFYKEGMIAYNDLLKSKVALSNAVQNRDRAKANADMAVSSLNTVLRFDINRATRLEDIHDVPELSFDIVTLLQEAMSNRPELQALRIALKNTDSAVKLAQSAYYPSAFLVGNYERMGDNPEAYNNEYTNDHNSSITLQAQWQFFEWGKTRAEVSRYSHEKLALMEKITAVEDGIRMEVKNAFLDTDVSKKNITTARESLDQAQENYRLTNLQYQQQITTSTEVLDARTYLSQAQVNYYGALYGYMISMARLDRAAGRIPGHHAAK
jgi:outer membrane protein